MIPCASPFWRTAFRIGVLASACAAAMLVWQAPIPRARAAEPAALLAQATQDNAATGEKRAPLPASDARAKQAPSAAKVAPPASSDAKVAAPVSPAQDEAKPTAPAPKEAAKTPDDTEENVSIGAKGIRIDKHGKHVQIEGLSGDKEYDSFESFVNDAPWLAGLVFMIVALIFATPLILIILVIWYKMRKTRMLNETMIKLAERGVVPTAGAMEALAAGRSVGPLPNGSSTTPLYDRVRSLQRQAAWSDLRKGVVLTALGLGFTFYWMFNSGSASWVGLILLFLGIGYCVLWFFEDRAPRASGESGAPPATGA